MRTPAWIESEPETAGGRAALLPLAVLARLYGLGARLDRELYRRGWRAVRRLPCSVVSVGSLAAGGSGKTPLAAWLAAALRAQGRRVALASRGYGRRRGGAGVEIVSDGVTIRCGADRAGDEPLVLAAQAPGVPVLVARDRGEAGWRAIRTFGTEILILDDGFQHHRLVRDLDLVVLDGGAGLCGGRVLPRGPLREPPSGLARADALVVMDGPLPRGDPERLSALAPAVPRFDARRVPRTLRSLGAPGEEPVAALRGREVGMLCGIARPASFRRTLEGCGARVCAERILPDHHRYRAADLAGLAGEAPFWVTTEKDAVKLDPAWVRDADLRVLAIGVQADSSLLDFVEARLAQLRTR
jgi:tetraacyldisaccharide 4'-kinase